MQQHGSKYFSLDPPLNLRVGSKGQNSFFSEYDRVANQIKGYDTLSNMVANILPTDPP